MLLPRTVLSILLAAALGLIGADAPAQTQSGPSASSPPATAAGVPAEPDLEILVKTTLAVFNAANVTGDYGALHKLGSPEFQRQVTEVLLVEAFKPFRDQKIEIGGIILHPVHFTEAPHMTERGWLKLVGIFETRPSRVKFRLQFHRLDERWQLVDIYVHVLPAGGENK